MSIDTRAPQVTTSQLMDWLKTTYAVPSGPSYPQNPNDGDFFYITSSPAHYAQWQANIYTWVDLGPGTGFEPGNLPTGTNTLEFYDTKSTDFAYLFLIHDPGNPPAPLLMTDQGFIVKKDLAVGGNILSGQGAFILGYGWTGSGTPTAYSPPLIELLNSTTQIQSGSSFPTGMNNQPGALFNRTDQGKLYIWSGSDWIASEPNPSGYYDTLFLVKNDGYSPANLNLNTLYANHIFSATSGNSITIDSSAIFGVDVTVGGTEYCNNDFVFSDASYPIHLHRTTRSVLGTTVGTLQVKDGGGMLATLDASNVCADHLTSASGNGIYVFDNLTACLPDQSRFVELWRDNAIIAKNLADLRIGFANDIQAGGWSEKMRLTVDGNLGVGTTSPTAKLHVKGGWLKVGDDGTADNSIQLETQSGFHRIAFQKLHFYDWGYGGDMMILDNGQLQLPAQGSSGGLRIGGNANLYWDSAYTLRLQNNLIVEQNLWCSQLAVDNNIGVPLGGTAPFFDGSSGGVPGTNLGFMNWRDTNFSGYRVLQMKGIFDNDSVYKFQYYYWNGNTWIGLAALNENGQFQLYAQGSSGGIRIGDVSIYREPNSANTLRLQNSLIVEQNLWCNSLAVDTNVGIGGMINCSSGGLLNGIAIGNAYYGSLTWPYESIQLAYNNNMRINFGTTEKYVFGNDGTFTVNNGNIMPSVANNGNVGNYTGTYWGSIAGNYVFYKTNHLLSFGCARELSDQVIERPFNTTDEAEAFLNHETSKQWRHIPYGAEEGTIKCICGKEAAEPCPEHLDEWNDRYLLKTGNMIEASGKLVVKLLDDVRALTSRLEQVEQKLSD